MKTVLITGANGFIGKNLVTTLARDDSVTLLTFTKEDSPSELEERIKRSDFIYHLAGVNRPKDDSEFAKNNAGLTAGIVEILIRNNLKTPLLVTSSTQAELDNPYGISKKAAEDAVFELHRSNGNPVFVYRLPGVFGKWCKPNYNSIVATICHNLTHNIETHIDDPNKSITLAYIDDVIDAFTSHLDTPQAEASDYEALQEIPRVFNITLGELESRLQSIHNVRTELIVPNLHDILNKFLYATYVSYVPTNEFSYQLTKNSDARGWLAEFVKSDSFGQMFISKTKPGISRGDHWHDTKVEKFLVVSGEAEITFRSELDKNGELLRYRVNGEDTTVLDIPTGYVHAITNVGDTDLITVFWANEIFNKDRPDTHYEKVEE